MAILTLDDCCYRYSKGTPFEKEAVRNISYTFAEGKITGIIGQTGSGKSTVAQMLNGLLKPDSGRVLLDGQDIFADPKKLQSVRFRVGIVFQYPEYQLFEETVFRDIAFGPKNMGLPEEEIKARVLRAAAFTRVSDTWLQKSPFELSGGEKRRVAIAGVMAMDPEILVLDEPAAGLDPRTRHAVLGGICAYQKETGKTVIIISHSMEDMAAYADRLLVLCDGTVASEGTRDHIFEDRDTLHRMGLSVPQVTKLMTELAARGVPVRQDIYTVGDAEAELCRALSGRTGGAEC